MAQLPVNKPSQPLVPAEIDPAVLDSKADLVNGEVPSDQLPSYVDDVLEFANASEFPAEGEEGKIYVDLETNLTYRWSGSAYIQINEVDLSNYYTKGEDDVLLAGKQNVIEDLATIRSGAAAGATALQEVPAEYVTEAELATYHDNTKQDVINDLNTIRSGAAAGATAVQPAALNNYQEKLVSGTNIKTINNTTILGPGNFDIAGDIAAAISASLASGGAIDNAIQAAIGNTLNEEF